MVRKAPQLCGFLCLDGRPSWQAQHLKQLWQESELGDREGAAEYMPMSSVRILDSQHPSVKPGSKAADRSHACRFAQKERAAGACPD